MKTFSVAVAVAVLLAFIGLQESSALPAPDPEEELGDFKDLVEFEEPMSDDSLAAAFEEEKARELEALMRNETLVAALEDMSDDSWQVPSNNRKKRDIWSRLKRKIFGKGKGKGRKGRRCRFCCDCNCGFSRCGTCCKF